MAAKRRDPLEDAREVLARSRGYALGYLRQAGEARTRELLKGAADDLEKRLRAAAGPRGPGKESFTYAQLKSTLEQVRHVTKGLNGGLKGLLLDQAGRASSAGAEGTAEYLRAADRAFRGVGSQPLALKVARMLEAAKDGSAASILARIASDPMHPGQPGVLARYGAATVRHFEKRLQLGIVAKKSRAEMADDLVEESPFLKGAPRHWAERIVRTESHGAINRASWESMRDADEQLGGGMFRVVVAVLDDWCGADSWNIHGQVRGMEEPFEYVSSSGATELFMYPPNRPNDRETVIPHRREWGPLPPFAQPIPTDRVVAVYAAQKLKFNGRPEMSTVEGFGEL